jgi:hypothetical protein
MPADGSSIFGAEISMPGIGPATVGLSGVELLLAEHAVSEAAVARAPTDRRIRDITFTREKCGKGTAVTTQMCAINRIGAKI